MIPSFDSNSSELTIDKEDWKIIFEMLQAECMFGAALMMLMPDAVPSAAAP